MTADLRLYFKPDCHLCEEAQGLLHALGLSFHLVDIETSLPLEVHYGLRIPVLQRGEGGAELDWPFDAARIQAWLEAVAP